LLLEQVMVNKTNNTEQAVKSCTECSEMQEVRKKLRISELLTKAIKGFEARLDDPDFKLTLSDYLKLIQMEKELDDEGPKEIKVTWVDPEVTSGPTE
jgi:hypothetical protein